MPREAWDAGSALPAYASTSVSSIATRPSAVSCSRTQPSSPGAASTEGRARKSRASSLALPVAGTVSGSPAGSAAMAGPGAGSGTARRGPGGTVVNGNAQRGELFRHPLRRRAAEALASRERALHGEHGADVGRQVPRHLRQVLVAHLVQG